MSRRLTLAAATVAVSALAVTSALAAATPNKAKTLALQKSDFPKGVVAKHASGEATAAGSGWSVEYHFRTGGRPRVLAVSVTVWKSRAHAVAMFKELKNDMLGIVPKLKLPGSPYGDEQAANHSVLGGSELLVRWGSVVWVLIPQTYMVRGGKAYELTKAQTVAMYQLYGRKQQRRVGAG